MQGERTNRTACPGPIPPGQYRDIFDGIDTLDTECCERLKLSSVSRHQCPSQSSNPRCAQMWATAKVLNCESFRPLNHRLNLIYSLASHDTMCCSENKSPADNGSSAEPGYRIPIAIAQPSHVRKFLGLSNSPSYNSIHGVWEATFLLTMYTGRVINKRRTHFVIIDVIGVFATFCKSIVFIFFTRKR